MPQPCQYVIQFIIEFYRTMPYSAARFPSCRKSAICQCPNVACIGVFMFLFDFSCNVLPGHGTSLNKLCVFTYAWFTVERGNLSILSILLPWHRIFSRSWRANNKNRCATTWRTYVFHAIPPSMPVSILNDRPVNGKWVVTVIQSLE
jgi:hypothetical protein